MSGYRLLDHTADIGIEAWGASAAEAFAQAARGLFAVILGAAPEAWGGSGSPVAIEVECSARTWPGLLVDWLAELLYRFDVDAFVPRAIAIDACAPPRLSARLDGLTLDDPALAAGVVVKAVTYHQLRVEVGETETRIHVILDI